MFTVLKDAYSFKGCYIATIVLLLLLPELIYGLNSLFIHLWHLGRLDGTETEFSMHLCSGMMFILCFLIFFIGAADYPSFKGLLKQMVGPLSTQLSDRRSSIVKQV